jgi:excisionase family DNA binding protein
LLIRKVQEKETFTTGEIAKYCNVNFSTVLRWIERGQLKAYQLPGRGDNRINLNDFRDFLRQYNMPVPEGLQDRSRRVLIVEDDSLVAESIQGILQEAGFETLIASDGFKAGSLLETFYPRVMTLDIRMPGLSGFEVLSFVKSRPALSLLKILVVSVASEEELNKALETGADDVLKKPFQNDILLEKVFRLAAIEDSKRG